MDRNSCHISVTDACGVAQILRRHDVASHRFPKHVTNRMSTLMHLELQATWTRRHVGRDREYRRVVDLDGMAHDLSSHGDSNSELGQNVLEHDGREHDVWSHETSSH